jgi:hypothetical protein
MTPEQIEAFQTVMAATLSQSEQVFLDALCDLALKGLQAEEMKKELETIFHRMEARTNHRVVCNADHSKPIGGDMCICVPVEYRALRREAEEMREAIDRTRNRLAFCIDNWPNVNKASLVDADADLEQALNERKEGT